MKRIITKNFNETQKLGKRIADQILSEKIKKSSVVVCLEGDLGGGKTTFLQGFAGGLKVKEKVLSPTFIIYRKFALIDLGFFYHFDCYRINKPEEILELGWKNIISEPGNIIAVEWPEKIKKYLPKNCVLIRFKFIDINSREIKIFGL